jgi:hypothetical protein
VIARHCGRSPTKSWVSAALKSPFSFKHGWTI